MDTLEVATKDWKPGERYLRAPEPGPGDRVVAGETRVVDGEGKTLCVTFPLDRAFWPQASFVARQLNQEKKLSGNCPCGHPWGRHGQLGKCAFCGCQRAPRMYWDDDVKGTKGGNYAGGRLSGLYYAHTTFGSVAPNIIRKRFGASVSACDRRYPAMGRVLREVGASFYETFGLLCPEEAASHEYLTGNIDTGWWLAPGAPWTAGIINKTVAIPYHRDSGNVKGSWSAQLVLRKGVGGGALHFPEFDIFMACENYSVVLFPNWGAWHGVTPLNGERLKGNYRYSIVYYAKQAMEKCAPPDEEIKRAQQEATKHEAGRLMKEAP